MKTTLNGYLYCQPGGRPDDNDVVNGYTLRWFTSKGMVDYGYTLIKPLAIEVELPDNWNPALQVIATLEAKKASVQAEFQARITEIDAAINKLLAIEFMGPV